MATKRNQGGLQHSERGVIKGVSLVDAKSGLPIDTLVDDEGKLRLLVSADVDITNATINVDLESDTDNVAIRNTANDNELLIESDGSISVRLLLSNGNDINVTNPLHTLPIGYHNTQVFAQNSVLVTTDTFTTVLSRTALANEKLAFIEVTGSVEAYCRISVNGTPIRAKYINSSNANIEFLFIEHRKLSSGDSIVVEVRADKTPPSFMGGAEFFASLQGYVD